MQWTRMRSIACTVANSKNEFLGYAYNDGNSTHKLLPFFVGKQIDQTKGENAINPICKITCP